MAVTISLSITQNSQSIPNNTSSVTVKASVKWTYGSYNATGQCYGSITIDGTKYSFSNLTFNTGKSTSGSQTIMTKTVTNIKHNDNGTKKLSCSTSFYTGVSSGTISASASKDLTTIPRKSTLTVKAGTLGTSQTLTVTKKSTNFAHTITYKCGSTTGTICTKSTDTSIDWTPPLTLANQAPNGTAVTVTFTITTYTSSTSSTTVGSDTASIVCQIPSSVKPTVSIAVSDPTGYMTTYGGYVQSKSKIKVVTTADGVYDSTIKGYSITANGKQYTSKDITTDVITGSGSQTINTTVTDSRGRTNTANTTIDILPYTAPKIINVTVKRCNADGASNSTGAYLGVTFKCEVSPLNNKNPVSYSVQYKRITDTEYTTVSLNNLAGQYNITDGTYVFPADSGSTYDVVLIVEDAFGEITKSTTGSSIRKLWSWYEKGLGIALGKVAEHENTFECDFDAKFNKPVYGTVFGLDRLPAIPENSDFNNYMSIGCFAVHSNAIAGTISNIPVPRAGRLEVSSATGEGIRSEQWSYIRQKYIPYNSSNAVWQRDITRDGNNVWTFYDWWQSSLTPIAAEKVYSTKGAITIGVNSTYNPPIPQSYSLVDFTETIINVNPDKFTLEDNSVKIGAGVDYVRVSGQILVTGKSDGSRHVRIRKMPNGKTFASDSKYISWCTINAVKDKQTVYPLTDVIVPVEEGDKIQMVFYTPDTTDSIADGSSGNGRQTYMTVSEFS